MSELAVGSIAGLAANSFVIDVASGSKIVQPGAILQVVRGETSTAAAITSSSYQDTGLSATITPTSSSSVILIFVSQPFWQNNSVTTFTDSTQAILRNSTVIRELYAPMRDANGVGTMVLSNSGSIVHQDSPATTSAITYKTQGKTTSTSIVFQDGSAYKSEIVLMEVAV